MTVEHEGERISYSYLPPKNAEQLALKRRNIEFWAQQTFGQMGRYPEFFARTGRRVARLDACDRKDQQAMGRQRPRLLSLLSAATIFASPTR